MKNILFNLLILSLLLVFNSIQILAQKNGVSGYGRTEIIYIGSELSGDVYIGAGGGIVVNDNFQFGFYLRALNKPYKYNFFESNPDSSFGQGIHPFSLNQFAISSSASNIETGVNLGFNIMPDKPFQITFNGMLGVNTVSFSELTATENLIGPPRVIFEDNSYTMFGVNSSFEINLQVKIGGFLKLGAKGGYHFAIINGKTRDGRLLKIPTMFSGPYMGASLIFGSF